MLDDRNIAEIRGDKPSMGHPVLFSGWGGEHCVVAIFRLCPEYISDGTVVLAFDNKSLMGYNIVIQPEIGSGFIVDTAVHESPDGRCSLFLMHTDASAVKDTILKGGQERKTQEI